MGIFFPQCHSADLLYICSENFGALNKWVDSVSWKYFFSFKGVPEFPPNSLLPFLLLVMVSLASSSRGAGGKACTSPGLCRTWWGWSTACVFLGETCPTGKCSFSWWDLSWTAQDRMACPSLLGKPVTPWRDSSHWMTPVVCQFGGEWGEWPRTYSGSG